MNESMHSRLTRLLDGDSGIYQVDILLKCKTRDGMIYTLDVTENRTQDCTKEIPFADVVNSGACENLLHWMDLAEKKDNFLLSLHEHVAIRCSEVTRVWAELGDIYTNSMPKE